MNLEKISIMSASKILNYKVLSSLLILLFLSVLINFSARVYEKNIWETNPSFFSLDGKPIVRTGDPAFFTNIAMYHKKGIPMTEYQGKLNYPNTPPSYDAPLLSILISHLAKDSSLEEIVKAGNQLILITSIITTIGVFLFFFSFGRPYEGIVASVGTSITSTYLLRSSIGYIDTDILNLFFMYILFAAIYISSKNQPLIKNIIFIIFAGLIGKIFFLWYPKPELIILSFISLFFFTIVNTKDWKKILLNSIIYILLTNPNIYINSVTIILQNPYLSGYLSANIQTIDLVNKTSLNFNSIFRFIGEQQAVPFLDLLKLNGSIFLGLLCFAGIILWGAMNPLLFIGFAPLSLFFLLSIVLGQRALFYSLPFMWFGFSYLINFIIFNFLKYKKIEINKYFIYFSTSLFLIIFIIFNSNAFNRDIQRSFISLNIYKAMTSMNDLIADKKNSVMVAPWTYGYQSLLYNDIPVLIHPGVPTSPRHYFIARAFTSFNLEETSKILNYIASGNVEKINEKKLDSFVNLSKDLYATPMTNKDIYIMLTQQQRKWINTDAATAYWDIEKNSPLYFNDTTAFDIFNIMEINCEDLDAINFTTKCATNENSDEKTIPVDLASGKWDGEPVLKRVVQIADGVVEINQEYENSKGDLVFQIVKNLKDNTSNLYLMHEAVFRSAYNKLFHLNQIENYELVYDDYPYVKIYKVN